MTTQRMMPPSGGPATAAGRANGRTYTCAIGSSIDVPSFDAAILEAQGWIISAAASGTTAARPSGAGLKVGTQFSDSTLGFNVQWDGKTWRNPSTGASA